MRFDRTILLLMGVLFAVRFSAVLGYPFLVSIKPEWTWSNNDGYDAIALNLVRYGTFGLAPDVPTASRLPLYPLLIAACYVLAGTSYPSAVMIVQAFLSCVTGYLMYRTALNLLGRSAGIAVLFLFVLHPQSSNFVFRCSTETLFVFLVMAFLSAAVNYIQKRTMRALVQASLWMGLSLLTRQTLAPLAVICLIVLALWAFFSPTSARAKLGHAFIAGVIVAAMLSPWIIRNYEKSGRVPVLQTWVGQPLYQGVYVSQNLSKFINGERTIAQLDAEALSLVVRKTQKYIRENRDNLRGPIEREVVADRYARKLARAEIGRDPARSIFLILRNLALAPVLQMTWKSTGVLMIWNWSLLILSFWGAILLFRRDRVRFIHATPLIVMFLYLLTIHAVVWPQARYVMPGLLPFSIFAGLTITFIACGFELRPCIMKKEAEKK